MTLCCPLAFGATTRSRARTRCGTQYRRADGSPGAKASIRRDLPQAGRRVPDGGKVRRAGRRNPPLATDLRGRVDRWLVEDLARQAGVAAHAARLTADLQRSRERLVTAREEERRRLRRDLHDGLGPQL